MERLRHKILVYDGAMGTILQKSGLKLNQCPESLNISHPEMIMGIHRAYVEAGADLIQTNTFGANRIKLSEFGMEHEVKRFNETGIQLARQAAGKDTLVVGDIGPLGKLIHPLGEMTFDQAYDVFYEQAKVLGDAGADLLAIETMSDLQEMRIALIAAKEAADLPIIAQMTFSADMRTLTGTDPETAVTVLESLGASIIGVNCGSGPKDMVPVIARMAKVSQAYLIAQPNAGLPQLINGKTVFQQTPEEMARYVKSFIEAGANIVGGCCGTTPDHIKVIARLAHSQHPASKNEIAYSKLASRSKIVCIGSTSPTQFIGERINPTARKKLAHSIVQGDMSLVCQEAQGQVKAGASILDVNMGVPNIEEAAVMIKAIESIQRLVDVPIAIDSTKPEVLEAGLKTFIGKPLINSVNGHEESLERILPLAKKYGASILGLTLDENGIPLTANKRLKVAQHIVNRALKLGIARDDIFIDCLVLTAGAQQSLVMETIKALKIVKEELGVKTVLGVSNVSYGLPHRELLNATYLAMALGNGLDLPILNPYQGNMIHTMRAADVLNNRDIHGQYFIQWEPETTINPVSFPESQKNSVKKLGEQYHPLFKGILEGDKEHIVRYIEAELTRGQKPLDLINQYLIPALELVGKKYEEKIYFLPQLMLAAETMKKAFLRLKVEMTPDKNEKKNTIVMATVKGDIHDIGKNIVSVILENHGFNIIDLGKDVSTDLIIQTAIRENAKIIGLSALMTTTMPEMARVTESLRVLGKPIEVMVGGAVVNAEYAKDIGAHYSHDAVEAVALAKRLARKISF